MTTNPTNVVMQMVVDGIKRVGWSAIGVGPTEAEPNSDPFVYTVGFEGSYGHPEMIVVGLPQRVGYSVLGHAAELIAGGQKFEPGVKSDALVVGFTVEFRGVTDQNRQDWLVGARGYYRALERKDWSAVQLVWPDPDGRFPWDAGYNPEKFPQPVLAT